MKSYLLGGLNKIPTRASLNLCYIFLFQLCYSRLSCRLIQIKQHLLFQQCNPLHLPKVYIDSQITYIFQYFPFVNYEYRSLSFLPLMVGFKIMSRDSNRISLHTTHTLLNERLTDHAGIISSVIYYFQLAQKCKMQYLLKPASHFHFSFIENILLVFDTRHFAYQQSEKQIHQKFLSAFI